MFVVPVLAAVLLALTLSVASASAEVKHPFVKSITEAKSAEKLKLPWDLTFDASGNLFVAEAAEGKQMVDKYGSSDAFSEQFTGGEFEGHFSRSVAVNVHTGVVYVGESGNEEIRVFKPKSGGGYEKAQAVKSSNFIYVAVDNSSGPHAGDVYAIEGPETASFYKTNAHGEIEEPSKAALTPPSSNPGSKFALINTGAANEGTGGLTVDGANGELFLAEPTVNAVSEYSSAGVFQKQLHGTETPATSFTPSGVAVEEASGALFVLDEAHNVIDEFNSSGKYIGQVTGIKSGEPFMNPLGVAVENAAGASQGEVFVSDTNVAFDTGKVDVFAAASASTTQPPAFLACVKTTKVGTTYTGKYTSKECTSASKVETNGKYERKEVTPKTPLTGKTKAMTLTAGGKVVKCKKGVNSGEILSSQTLSETLTFEKCGVNGSSKAPCTTSGLAAGTIKSAPLTGELQYVNSSETEVGLVLFASGNDFEVTCNTTEAVVVRGAVVGGLTDTKKGQSIAFKVVAGKQEHQADWVEGGEETSAGGQPLHLFTEPGKAEATFEATDEEGPKGVGAYVE